MYLNNVLSVAYADPWNIPLEERLKALEGGHRRVAYIYLWPDYYVFRYRVYNMVQALQESDKETAAAFFTHNDLNSMDRVVDIADVIVICRTKYDQDLNHIINRAHTKGKIVFFDVDDLVFDVKDIHLILTTHDLDRNDPLYLDNWFAHIGRISATMQLCDRAITTNGYLAAHLQHFFKEEVVVIPNFLNREQMGISERIYKEKQASGFARSDRKHLGYFSGTPSHDEDFTVATDALAKILENNPQVTLRVVGPLNIRGPLRNFSSQIERYPLQDFLNLQRLIGEVEVNLVPLQNTRFTNCKSELKYFEAGIVGTISIATPTFSYVRAIQDGKNGFLAKSSEWYEKIQSLLDKITDPDSVEIAEKAMVHSERYYAWYNQTSLIENALFEEGKSSIPDSVRELSIKSHARQEEFSVINNEEVLTLIDLLQQAHHKYDKLQNEVRERDMVFRSQSTELAEIHKSRSWKAVKLYRNTRMLLIPEGSLQEMSFKFFKGIFLYPLDTIKKTRNRIQRIINEPRRHAIRIQDELIKKNFANDTSRLIVFLVPGVNGVNGGIMSICSLAKVSKSLISIHNSKVLIATLPGSPPLTKYTYFENPFDIYRFEQLYSYFTKIEALTIHLPENFVSGFLSNLTKADKELLDRIPKLTINILNQNVWLMPSREIVNQVKQFTDSVTCTTAHSRYCTQEMRRHYGIPFHNFSASNLTNYYHLPYEQKENLIIVSHDEHALKEMLLDKIQQENPEISIKRIKNVPYEEYKRLLSRAKWAITFGEGLDGYFVESIRSGAIPFAVYNKDFFTDRFMGLPNVYLSYEEMYNNLTADLRNINEPHYFKKLSEQLIELDKQEYDDEKYKDNIKRYYLGNYDLP